MIVTKFEGENNRKTIEEIQEKVDNCIIIKGARIYNGKSNIIYVIDYNTNHRYFKNKPLNLSSVTRNGKKITFEFVPWESIKIINKSMISGAMNIVSDENTYCTFIIGGNNSEENS